MTFGALRLAVVASIALSLAGCVTSTSPVLTGAQPEFGQRLRLQLYTLRDGFAREPIQAHFNWNGNLYANVGPSLRDIGAFSVHPFEGGDYIIQSVPAKKAAATDYALLHKLTDGLWLVTAIDESDAEQTTRTTYCPQPGNAGCRIETRDQLFALARATAAKKQEGGGLVIRLPNGNEQSQRKRRPSR